MCSGSHYRSPSKELSKNNWFALDKLVASIGKNWCNVVKSRYCKGNFS